MKKQHIIIVLAFLLTATSAVVLAQSAPVSDTLQINSIRARVQSNGAFFLGGTNGELLAPAVTGAVPSISLMKAAGLWLGGRDSAGNLKLSAQLLNENGKTDFYPGILDQNGVPFPEANFIADVTGVEVAAHIADPATPIPAIYGWPGRGNPYFASYHGFDLPYSLYGSYGGFYDKDGNARYDPSGGEYPAIDLRGCPFRFKVDEAMWFPFHDVGPHTQSGAEPLHQEIQAQVFGYNCPEGSPDDRLIYVIYRLRNRDTVPLDSCYFGVYFDFEIGNGGDDYIGCDPLHHFVYAYNGDNVDEGGFENTPPVMAVDLLRGPFNPETGEEVQEWHFVPVDDDALNSPQAYYNLLAGRHTDGTPFPNNGRLYTGDPLNPAAWTEASAGNPPGERRALASFGPFTLLPGAVNEIVLGYVWVRKDPNGSVADNLSILQPTMKAVQAAFDNCFDLFDGCPGNVPTNSPVANLQLTVLPNPAADFVRIESGGIPMQSILLYDATGRLLRAIQAGDNISVTIPTGDLPAGMYGLQVRAKDGRPGYYKFIHE